MFFLLVQFDLKNIDMNLGNFQVTIGLVLGFCVKEIIDLMLLIIPKDAIIYIHTGWSGNNFLFKFINT